MFVASELAPVCSGYSRHLGSWSLSPEISAEKRKQNPAADRHFRLCRDDAAKLNISLTVKNRCHFRGGPVAPGSLAGLFLGANRDNLPWDHVC